MRPATRPSAPDPIASAVADALDTVADSLSQAEHEMLVFVDGLLTAAAIGPERTYPHEWVRAVFQDHRFEDADTAQASSALLSLMHNEILSDLRRMRADYSPRFLRDAEVGEDVALAGQWANGFVTGMLLRGDAWAALVDTNEAMTVLIPILVFLTREDGTPLLTQCAEEIADLREEALPLLGPAIYNVYQYWQAHSRRSQPKAIDPLRKTGRNEPCPCGSGKKFKKCCLDRPQ